MSNKPRVFFSEFFINFQVSVKYIYMTYNGASAELAEILLICRSSHADQNFS